MPAALALLATATLGAAAPAVTDQYGGLTALLAAGESYPVTVAWRIPQRGWGRMLGAWDARDHRIERVGDTTRYSGRVDGGEGYRYRYEQAVRPADGGVELELSVTAEAGGDTEGVYVWVDVPIATYAGGTATIGTGAGERAATMPPERPANRHFLTGDGAAATLTAPGGAPRLTITFDRPLPVTVQDTREWNGGDYSLFARVSESLPTGGSTHLVMRLALAAEPDHAPARLTVDPRQRRYRLAGFGGNYCFGIESPVTQYTLANLRVAQARCELTALEWEPENDNDDPNTPNWDAYRARDAEGSNLRREFLLAKQIQDKGIPYCVSIWPLPEWLLEDPGQGTEAFGRIVPPALWPEMLELIGTYLVHAKERYGVEPDLFSFNEPDYGVRIKFTPETHRDAIKAFGAHFAKLGLKTKLLLADVAQPRGSHTFCAPTEADPEALRYVGAVGFHSWGGAAPEQYAAWADTAERLNLPLLVAELGVDAQAWRGGTYDSFDYGLREVRHYQEILLHARPRATMQWEFTNDYGVARADGEGNVTPTARFHFVRHFCNLTPPDAWALGTASDHAKVLVTAFATDEPAAFTVHVANLAAGRRATLEGLPAGLTRLRAVRTSATEGFAELPPVPVRGGRVELELAEQSLLTLTTVPGG